MTELKELPKNLTKIEIDILKERKNGLAISQTLSDRLKCDTDKLVFVGAAIYGSAIPATEFFADIICEEVINFIFGSGIENLAFGEILLALRFNTKNNFNPPKGLELEMINFTGTTFNINFLSKVVFNYMQIRNLLDRKIQNQIDGYEF